MFFKTLVRDYSNSALLTGLVAVLVSYAGPLAVVFQAADAASLTETQLSSWIWSISVASAASGFFLSWKYKMPVITAWSTPGAALVSALGQYSYPEAIGAFIVCSTLIIIFGLTGFFQKMMNLIPGSIGAAMLAGILFQFGREVFINLNVMPGLVLPVIAAYLAGKKLFPRYAIFAALATGCAMVNLLGLNGPLNPSLSWAQPLLTVPQFSWPSIVGLALPLFVVTMTSQNIPGIAVLQADGFKPKANDLITGTGLAGLLTAPFGSHAINLAAITAAICTGPESNAVKEKRYIAGLSCGLFYFLVSFLGAAIVVIFNMLPSALISTVAGLALFSSIISSLTASMAVASEREAALVAFLVTVSDLKIFNISSPFWGLIGGFTVLIILNASIKKN